MTRTPPGASIEGGPSKGTPSPSAVAFSFASHVLNGSVGAPVVAAQCLLQPLYGGAQPQVLHGALPMQVLAKAGAVACGGSNDA